MTTTQPAPATTRAARWTPAQRFAFLFGVVYFVVGLAGFPVTGTGDFAGHQHHHTLLIFSVNPLHNVVHLVLGLAWLAGSARHRTARAVNLALGVVLGLVTVLGFAGGMYLRPGQLPAPRHRHGVAVLRLGRGRHAGPGGDAGGLIGPPRNLPGTPRGRVPALFTLLKQDGALFGNRRTAPSTPRPPHPRGAPTRRPSRRSS
jgi:hypothetical protein